MVIITYQPLPRSVPALVHENDDTSYTIIINDALSDAAKKKAAIHELRHIERGDLGSEQDVNHVEASCHKNDNSKKVLREYSDITYK